MAEINKISSSKLKSRNLLDGFQLSIDCVHPLLKNINYSQRLGAGLPIYLAPVFE